LFVVRIPSVQPTAPSHRATNQSFISTTKLPQDAHSEAPGMRHFTTNFMVVAI